MPARFAVLGQLPSLPRPDAGHGVAAFPQQAGGAPPHPPHLGGGGDGDPPTWCALGIRPGPDRRAVSSSMAVNMGFWWVRVPHYLACLAFWGKCVWCLPRRRTPLGVLCVEPSWKAWSHSEWGVCLAKRKKQQSSLQGTRAVLPLGSTKRAWSAATHRERAAVGCRGTANRAPSSAAPDEQSGSVSSHRHRLDWTPSWRPAGPSRSTASRFFEATLTSMLASVCKNDEIT